MVVAHAGILERKSHARKKLFYKFKLNLNLVSQNNNNLRSFLQSESHLLHKTMLQHTLKSHCGYNSIINVLYRTHSNVSKYRHNKSSSIKHLGFSSCLPVVIINLFPQLLKKKITGIRLYK